MVKVVYVNYFGLKIVFLLSIMRTCDLICQKKVNGKTSLSVEKDKWAIFFSRYELSNVERYYV